LLGKSVSDQEKEPEKAVHKSQSNSILEPVLVGLKERKLESLLDQPFDPQHDQTITVRAAENDSLILQVEDLQFLAFANRPLHIDFRKTGNFFEVIETFKSGKFKVRVPANQVADTGFFGVAASPEDRYKYIFFPHNSIRIRFQQRPVGEILLEKSFVAKGVLHDVLRIQYQLRCLRLGTIIAKKASLKPLQVEKNLKKAWQNKNYPKMYTGDLLVETGLVSSQVAMQSLAFQKKIRHLRLGELLVYLGFITEGQKYEVLAEKFRKRFVQLQNITPTHEALTCLPQKFIHRLEIIPICFQDERLVIATANPNSGNLGDILKETLHRPFELVVCPRSQIFKTLASLSG